MGDFFWEMSVVSKPCDWPSFYKMGTLLQGRNIMPCPTKYLCLCLVACRASAVIGFVREKRAQSLVIIIITIMTLITISFFPIIYSGSWSRRHPQHHSSIHSWKNEPFKGGASVVVVGKP